MGRAGLPFLVYKPGPNRGRTQKIYAPKLDLTTDAEHLANLAMSIIMWLQTCNSAVYYMGMLNVHDDIFLTDIRVKFMPPK